MNRYRLFNEFCEHEIYGDTLGDALLHCGPITVLTEVRNGVVYRAPKMVVTEILGTIPTPGSTRGSSTFESVLVHTSVGVRVRVDAVLIGLVSPLPASADPGGVA